MKRIFALTLAAALSLNTVAMAAPKKQGTSIAGIGNANRMSTLDYKGDTEVGISTGSGVVEKIPPTGQSSLGEGVVANTMPERVELSSAELEEAAKNPFSDLYFDDISNGPSDEAVSWMVENGVVSRDHNVRLGRDGLTVVEQYPLYDRGDTLIAMKKSDFLVGVYKALFGPINARPLVFRTDSKRDAQKITYRYVEDEEGNGSWETNVGSLSKQVTSTIDKADTVTSTFADYGEFLYKPFGDLPEGIYINKNGDLLYYLNANVYENYFVQMLEKNLIDSSEISDLDLKIDFQNITTSKGSNPKLPEWFYTIGAKTISKGPNQPEISYEKSGSTKILGKRYEISGEGTDNVSVQYKPHNYFMQEQMTALEALRYVEKFLRVTEEDMTHAEAELVSYKYGVTYLDNYTEEERKTLMYLVAKGIINFENPEEYRNLYGVLTEDFAYTLVYRLARPEARKNFSEIQLTDNDNFWIGKGYQQSNYSLKVENDTKSVRLAGEDGSLVALPIPNVETVSVTSSGGVPVDTSSNEKFFEHSTVRQLYADDDDNLKTFTVVKEFDNLEKYKFNGYKFSEWKTSGSADPIITFTQPEGNRVTFTVKAVSDTAALAAVDSKIQVATDSVFDNYSLQTVTKLSDGGKEITLVHQSIFQDAASEIMVVEDKVLRNKRTGATALLLPDNGMAMVGSQVIISDDIMVTSVNNEIYYNLEVIVPLMSNAYMSDIDKFDIYMVKGLYDEKEVKTVSPSGNATGSILTMTLDASDSSKLAKSAVTKYSDNSSSEISYQQLMTELAKAQSKLDASGENPPVQTGTFDLINLSQATESSNHLIRDFSITTAEGKSVTYKLLVYWNYSPPNPNYKYESPDVHGTNPSLKEVSATLTTRPKTRSLAEWWDNNLELSNAFANVIYGTTGVTYVQNGYLVPNVRVMFEENETVSDSLIYELMVKVGSQLSSKFVNTYIGTNKYNQKVSSSNPSDLTGKFYPAKNLTEDLFPLWVHAMFNNKQGLASGNLGKISDIPTNGRANTELWRMMMAERSLGYSRPSYAVGGLKFYTIGQDVFALTDSNVLFKVDSTQSAIMPGSIENGQFHMKSRTGENLADLKSLVGKTVTYEGKNGEVASFRYLGLDGNCLMLLDESAAVGQPTIKQLSSRAYVDVDGRMEFPNGSTGGRSGSVFTDRYNTLVGQFNEEAGAKAASSLGEIDTPVGLPPDRNGIYVVSRPDSSKEKQNDSQVFKRYGKTNESLSMNSLLRNEEVRAHALIKVNFNYFKISSSGVIFYNPSPSVFADGNVFFSSLNKNLIDSILAKHQKVISVNKLTDGQKLVFTDVTLLRYGNSFYSEPQKNLAAWSNLINAYKNPTRQDLAVKKYFLKTIIDTSRKQVSLSNFIHKASLGRIKDGIVPDNTLVGSPTSTTTALLFKADGSSVEYRGPQDHDLVKSVTFKVDLDDSLLCRLIDQDQQIYELIYATNGLDTGTLENLPFFDEDLELSAKDDLYRRLNLSDFKLSYMADELKERFMENYKAARRMEAKELLQFALLLFAVFYTMMLWFAWVIVEGGLGLGILTSLKYPTRGAHTGFDLVKIMTFGTYSLESRIDAGRVFISTFILLLLASMLTIL